MATLTERELAVLRLANKERIHITLPEYLIRSSATDYEGLGFTGPQLVSCARDLQAKGYLSFDDYDMEYEIVEWYWYLTDEGLGALGEADSLFPPNSRLALFPHNDQIVGATLAFEKFFGASPSLGDLLQLTSFQFEQFVAEIWHRLGYEIEMTSRTRDGGRDVIAVKRREAQLRFLIECKRFDPSRKVGVSLVRALHGVKVHENANKAFLATTSSFSRPAREYVSAHVWELEARDYEGILSWVKLLSQGSGH
jgi:hypothetical protein